MKDSVFGVMYGQVPDFSNLEKRVASENPDLKDSETCSVPSDAAFVVDINKLVSKYSGKYHENN